MSKSSLIVILRHPTYTFSFYQRKSIRSLSSQKKKKGIAVHRRVIWFLEQFLADVISVRMIDGSSRWRINNIVKYTVLCVSGACDPLTFTPPLRCHIYSWSHLYSVSHGFFIYSRVRETTERERERERDGRRDGGKIDGYLLPSILFPARTLRGRLFSLR